uniref:hypothetical protein n=1 Tax=Paractinoplanes polyasparticus TaxID=2856853 RepID=UPI001C853BC9|nr:hypothetical protein [Actinoplanes polyasparticus]
MRLPTFSRQSTSDTTETPERPAATGTVTRPHEDNTTEVRPAPSPVRARRDEPDTLTDLPPAPKHASRTDTPPPPPAATTTARPAPATTTGGPTARPTGSAAVDHPVAAGPKPRASLLATLGLILAVASVLLVLSGPLMGYGLGVAGLALVLSLSGIHATGKRHVAGKTDALLGMILSLGAIVLGVLALTGALSWLGTDTQPVNTVREWLDARFIDRF